MLRKCGGVGSSKGEKGSKEKKMDETKSQKKLVKNESETWAGRVTLKTKDTSSQETGRRNKY